MNRRIVTAEDIAAAPDQAAGDGVDGYFDRVLKCIPVEVVAVYVVVASAAQPAFTGRALQWWLFLLLLAGTVAAPLYARSALGIRRLSQLAMTTVAFVAVAAATGGWFGTLSWWNGFFPVLATVLFGVSVALLDFGPARPRSVRASPPVPPGIEETDGDDEPTGLVEPRQPEDESGLLRVWRGADPPR